MQCTNELTCVECVKNCDYFANFNGAHLCTPPGQILPEVWDIFMPAGSVEDCPTEPAPSLAPSSIFNTTMWMWPTFISIIIAIFIGIFIYHGRRYVRRIFSRTGTAIRYEEHSMNEETSIASF